MIIVLVLGGIIMVWGVTIGTFVAGYSFGLAKACTDKRAELSTGFRNFKNELMG